MTDNPTRSLVDDQSFFGEAPGRLQALADEAERRFEHAGIGYGDALIALGNAHTIHASSAKEALSAFEKALAVYSLVLPNDVQVADAHHRVAMVLRRLEEHGRAAEHLAKAIEIWEENGTAEDYGLIRLLIHVHARRAVCSLPEPARHNVRAWTRPPRFRAKNVSTCTRSPTARGSSHASHLP